MEWSHTHFDGYELLAVPAESPASIVLLDSSALVLVQRVLLPEGDSPPRSLTWQPGGARNGCSSGALSCIVYAGGGRAELAVFTPNGVYLSSRVRYSWSCAARVPLSPLHKGVGGEILLAWSCRGPLVIADEALSVWSNSRGVPSANANTFSSDESDASSSEDASANDEEEKRSCRPRSVFRNALRLSRKWVRNRVTADRVGPAPRFVALATSPCGCMFAAACKGSDEVIVWLRRRNMPLQEKPWDDETEQETERVAGGGEQQGRHRPEGLWNFQPATVLAHDGPVVQVVWGRGSGAQQDYLLTLGEDGSARVWVEQQWQERLPQPTETGSVKFTQAATIKSWYGEGLRLRTVGFVKWAYFGSHSRDLVHDVGTASGSAYHLVHQQEQEANGGTTPCRSDNWVVGCGHDGRRFLWSLKDMPLPDGRTTPEPVEVASLPFSWLVGLSAGSGVSTASSVVPLVSAVGYYDAQGADGAPTEIQIVSRAAGGTIEVITARVHCADARSRFVFRNVRSVVLPLGQAAVPVLPAVNGEEASASEDWAEVDETGCTGELEGLAHPNLPLIARLGKRRGRGGGWAVEVHSWVNGESHLQCIPCTPRGAAHGQPGHTAGDELEHAGAVKSDRGGAVAVSGNSLSSGGSSAGDRKEKYGVAPIFGELAQKVRAGDELSFVPYSLPSLTLGCCSCEGDRSGKCITGGGNGKLCCCGKEAGCGSSSRGQQNDVKHAMWLADWIGAEALPPALVVVDAESRLHVFELDDGAASEVSSCSSDSTGGSSAGTPYGVDHLKAGMMSRRTSAKSSTSSLMSLTHSERNLPLKGLGDMHVEPDPSRLSPERMSRRARGEYGGKDDGPPIEKTVVLPLDSKYGLGLTLAFEDNRVEVSTFVKHPDTSEMLPAEASGRMRPGDELVEINGHSVEGLDAEEATALIRQARRESMEGGAVSLELTFRESTSEPSPTPVRSSSRSRSPKPRTGWYARRSKKGGLGVGGAGRGSAIGSTAAGWASTDADEKALRWHAVGSDELPAMTTCTLLPWLGGGWKSEERVAAARGGLESTGGGHGAPSADGQWTEIGVYPPGDGRRRREALLLGFQKAVAQELPPQSVESGGEGYVVALLVEARAQGGVSVTEVCRVPLETGQEPVSFNREKTPPGAPTSCRGTAEAVCADGWVRRWNVACSPPCAWDGDVVGDDQRKSFVIHRVDICRPFFVRSGSSRMKTSAERCDSVPAVAPLDALIAVASPTLLAVARRTTGESQHQVPPPEEASEVSPTASRATKRTPEARPVLEVWSCSPTTPYPRCPFKKEQTVTFSSIGTDQAVEGMCWVSPEAGDERGAAVSGHCLCVSAGGLVTVLARERRGQRGGSPAAPGLAPAWESSSVDGGEWMWSPIFRVANPSSLLTCRTAGLRDFCQGLMAKYQRNLALSLVRSRYSEPLRSAAGSTKPKATEETISDPARLPARPLSIPLPLSRSELDGLRGGTTQEGRRLEDWHPESLAALWCTSLMVGERATRGGWARGRERTLAVLRWVSKEADTEAGGVVAGTVVPFLAHEGGGAAGDNVDDADAGLRKLSACLAAYARHRLEDEKSEKREEAGEGFSKPSASAASARFDPPAGIRRPGNDGKGDATHPSTRQVVDIASAAGIPRRLLRLSGAELSALAALLDEALGQGVHLSTASVAPSSSAGPVPAGDTAAALFSFSGGAAAARPPPPKAPLSGFDDLMAAPVKQSDDCANVFLLARGLRARLISGTGAATAGGSGETGVASSAALGMLLSTSKTQKEVLKVLCPKGAGMGLSCGAELGLTWGEARALLVPFWLRDVTQLQRFTEVVAANTFREDRDLMAAAMFFAALGQERKLLALAKADRSFVGHRPLSGHEGDISSSDGRAQGATQGQRLEKLLAHDFASSRGRGVAEKNAYILLRKRSFKAAAAVFLLARPAMLKEALQVILMHVKDLQLALVIARLVEVRDAVATTATPSAEAGGSARGFGGGFGGGLGGGFSGGFAAGGIDGDDGEDGIDAAAAQASLGGASKKLLRDEFLPAFDGECDVPKDWKRRGSSARQQSFASAGDSQAAPQQRNAFLECATLFWLGQSERALRALCRGQAAERNTHGAAFPSPSRTAVTDGHVSSGKLISTTVGMDGAVGLDMCNRAIDVATRPLLVDKLMRSHICTGSGSSKSTPPRATWGMGSGAASIRGRLQMASNGAAGGGETPGGKYSKAAERAKLAAAVRLTTVEYLARNGMELAALEVLGTAAGKEMASELAQQFAEEGSQPETGVVEAEGAGRGEGGDYSGSLVSGTDARLRGAGTATASASGEISGDMFGGFDGPPKPQSKAPLASGELSGDVFGGFGCPPRPRPKSPAAAPLASGELSGDMLGGFDGPPKTKSKASVAAPLASGELSGDMFGGFDRPPRARPNSPARPPLSSGELSGDMLGGFDGPPKTQSKAPAVAPVATGELSGDMFGGFDGPPRTRPKSPAAAPLASGELSGNTSSDIDGAPLQQKDKPTAAKAKPGPGDAVPAEHSDKAMDGSGGDDASMGTLSTSQSPLSAPGKTMGQVQVPPRQAHVAALATGELSGGLLGSFDGPPKDSRRGSSRGAGSPSPSAIWSPYSSRPASRAGSPEPPGLDPSHEGVAIGYGYQEWGEPGWDAYDSYAKGQTAELDGADAESGEEGAKSPSQRPDSSVDIPQGWALRAEDLAYEAATKRLLREMRHHFGGLDALAPTAPNMAYALEALGTVDAVSPADRTSKQPPALLEGVCAATTALCNAHGLSARALTAAAAGTLYHVAAGGSRRLSALCLLLHALDRQVAVDATVCAAASRLVQCCSAHSQAHLEDLSLRAAYARAAGTVAEEARAQAEAERSEEEGATADADGSRVRPAGSFTSVVSSAALAGAERKEAEVRAANELAAAAAAGLGLENLRPHLSELRSAAFQLELCLNLHARGCLTLSSRARAEATVGLRAGLLVEALGKRYDVAAALVACPPADIEPDDLVLPVSRDHDGENNTSDAEGSSPSVEGRVQYLAGASGGDGERSGRDTPNSDLLEALSRLPRPEFDALGLEPWESSLSGRPTLRKYHKRAKGVSGMPSALAETALPASDRVEPSADNPAGPHEEPEGAADERLCLVRLTDSLTRGVWPTYARLACALNLLALRAMHAQLCGTLGRLPCRRNFRARAPLAARVCGNVPFHPAREGGEAVGAQLAVHPEVGGLARTGEGHVVGSGSSAPSSTFYSAFLHPLYVWAQCLDRQFYAQAHRPTYSPAHHLVPRRHDRMISDTSLTTRACEGDAPTLVPTGGIEGGKERFPSKYESTMMSPGAHKRECCPYLFQRGMVVSEEGVRGGLDHLRSEETWSEEDSEDGIAYEMLNGIRLADGSALPSVPLHAIREGNGVDAHFVEAFYSSDARIWLMRAGVDPAGPSAGDRLRRWEKLGIVQRVMKAQTGGQIHFRGERHKGDALLRFVDRWEVEHCGESGGGALRAGPLGRMSYQAVPVGRSAAGLDTLYGRLLFAIGEQAACDLWTRLGAEDWLVKTVSRAEFPFSYRHQLGDISSASPGEVATATVAAQVMPLTPAAAAAAASEMPCPLHDGKRQERDAFCLCVFEHLCRNALFRRLRLPHRFQALVTVQLLGLKNLSPHYHPAKTDVFAAVCLKRPDLVTAVGGSGGGGGGQINGHGGGGETPAKRVGRDTSVTSLKRLLPTANGQASQQSRWGAKAAFRFPLPEEASPYVLAYGDRAYDLVMGGYGGHGGGRRGGRGMGSQGPPLCVRISVWRKMFLSDQRLGEVEVPLAKLNDRRDVDEWVGLRGDKGSAWFVNIRLSLRFVMVNVSDPIPEAEQNDGEGEAPTSPGMTLSHALEDVDIM